MRLWYKQVLRFESVSCTRLLEYTSFPFTNVFRAGAGGGHTQAFVSTRLCCVEEYTSLPSQECFGQALVVKHKLFYRVIVVPVGTCGVHTSFLSKEFQECE